MRKYIRQDKQDRRLIFILIILICICLAIALLQGMEEVLTPYDGIMENDVDLTSEAKEMDNNTDEYKGSSDWIVFKEDGLYGYMDKNQNIMIPPQFDGAYPFSEGLASVYMHDMLPDCETDCWYGFIDTSGEFVIPCIYDGAGSFNDGLAVVREFRDRPEYYINKDGEKAFGDKTFPEANSFSEGYAPVVTKDGASFPIPGKQNKWTYIDKTGNYATKKEFEEARRFHGGYAKVKNNGKWGMINTEFKLVVRYRYNDENSF